MTLPRADRLREPPIVGRYYSVPAIAWRWAGAFDQELAGGDFFWPVLGNKHDDLEFFDFPHKHYHVDPRFFTNRHWAQLGDRKYDNEGKKLDENGKLLTALARPLSSIHYSDWPPSPVFRRMRCSASGIIYSNWASRTVAVQSLNSKFAGKQCDSSVLGWICPHRQLALGSMEPVDGMITCPLHGLRIDATTGKCIGPIPLEKSADANQFPQAKEVAFV